MDSARVNDKAEQEQGKSQIDAFYFEAGGRDGRRRSGPGELWGPDYKEEAHANADESTD
jgi:hypothetical protein